MGNQLEALLDLIYDLEAHASDADFLASRYLVVLQGDLDALVSAAENADPRLEDGYEG